eukprot:scaffold49569_cov69-Phaeocystis_antarctica.AAC.1
MSWECARAWGRNSWKAWKYGIGTMQSRCSASGSITSRPLRCMDPPRHICTLAAHRHLWVLLQLDVGLGYMQVDEVGGRSTFSRVDGV